ncbi:MAG: heavy metal transporter [Deltaproteobacteria bacterium]|nr:MAG: heavy metal transporter [Deltaproteobacteria bacterium]
MSTYKIQGMTCGGCVNSVTKALEAALPDTKVEVTLETNQVSIEGDHDAQRVERAIDDAGFDFGGAVAK